MMNNAGFLDVITCGTCKNKVSEERVASIIRAKRIRELGTTLAVTINQYYFEGCFSYRLLLTFLSR
jgi:hypothetical protein